MEWLSDGILVIAHHGPSHICVTDAQKWTARRTPLLSGSHPTNFIPMVNPLYVTEDTAPGLRRIVRSIRVDHVGTS